jgi:hypothetical protein
MIKEKCNLCGKIFEGYTKKQLERMIAVHMISCPKRMTR